MAPVFAFRWQLHLFLLTLLLMAAFPFMPKPEWMDRRTLHRSYFFGGHNGYGYAYELLSHPEKIDILVLGASAAGSALNPHMITDHLKKEWGRDAVVKVAYHPKKSYAMDYILMQDILRVRPVGMVLWDATRSKMYNRNEEPAPEDYRVSVSHNETDEVISRLLWDYSIHGELMKKIELPLHKLLIPNALHAYIMLVSPLLDTDSTAYEVPHLQVCRKLEDHGSCLRRYEKHPDPNVAVDIQQPVNKTIHSRSKKSPHASYTQPYTPEERLLLGSMTKLTQEHGTSLVLIRPPITSDAEVMEPCRLAQSHPAYALPILGIAKKDLFAHVRGHFNPFFVKNSVTHLNVSGTNLHTAALLPGLSELYAQANQLSEVPSAESQLEKDF